MTGELIKGQVLNIIEENNSAIILKMEDGAVLRLKVNIAQVVRFPNPTHSGGEPIYHIQSNNSFSLLDLPTDLELEYE